MVNATFNICQTISSHHFASLNLILSSFIRSSNSSFVPSTIRKEINQKKMQKSLSEKYDARFLQCPQHVFLWLQFSHLSLL